MHNLPAHRGTRGNWRRNRRATICGIPAGRKQVTCAEGFTRLFAVTSIMMEVFTREELKKELEGNFWVFGYNELVASYDKRNDIIELIEDYAPANGLFAEAWRAFHFPRTSPIVKSSRREGTKTIFRIKPGISELKLIPAFAPIGIESAEINNDEISITYSGYGGGGVSASYCRGLAKGVLRVEIYERGGGSKFGKAKVVLPMLEKVIVSVDDTDTPDEGATYSLVHNIADKINCAEMRYFTHVNAQLFPGTPHKTKNCMSTAVSFLCKPGMKNTIADVFKEKLKKYTLSEHTGMVIYSGVLIPEKVYDYGIRAKEGLISHVGEALKIAEDNNVDAYEITGKRGIIGALAGLGLHDDPELAASLPEY